jgi:hypothetical protein
MKVLSMQKVVTVLNVTYFPYCVKYGDLSEELANDTQIEVDFPKGMYKHRIKQLAELGFTLAGNWKWEPKDEDPIWSSYRGVFQRAQ